MRSDDASHPGSRIPGEIRVEGMLRLAPDTLYEGDVHAPGGLVARPGAIVAGDVYTDGPVQLAATARIGGRVRPAGAGTSSAQGPSSSPTGSGCLRRLLARAEAGTLTEEDLEAGLAQLADTLLDAAPGDAWSIEALREALFGRGLARLALVTIEEEADETFLLRIREGAADGGDAEALVHLARRLGQAARPGTSLHPLSSPTTPGETVLLVQP